MAATATDEVAAALRQSESRYRSLVENSLNGVVQLRVLFTNSEPDDFVFVETNAAFDAQLGLGDVIGKRVSDVVPSFRTADPVLFGTYCRVAVSGIPERFETYSAAVDQWFTFSVYRVNLDHIVVVLEDITLRKRAERAVAASESKFATAFHNGSAGMAMSRAADHMLVEVNARFAAIIGHPRESVIGRTGVELGIISEARSLELRAELARGDGALHDLELDIMRGDGQIATVLCSVEPVSIGGVPHRLLTFVEITALKRTEERLRTSEERLRKSEEHLQQLNTELELRVRERTAELESFSYSISHDLRAPLRAVNGYAQLVLEDYGECLPDEGRRLLRTIGDAGVRMGILIDDLLRFAQLGRRALHRAPIDTKGLVVSVLNELLRGRPPQTVELSIGELPACVGDEALLRQVWINLASNALKYSRDRTPAIIEVGHADDGTYYIRDNGVGFDMRYVDRLFGVFQRLHTAKDFEGEGIGLAIVERIIHRHGGRVWADSEQGRGSTFSFTLGDGRDATAA